jgi:dihydrofolate synthase/folylpolyglutamate synthase
VQSDEAISEGVMDIFEDKANSCGSRLVRFGADWISEANGNQIRFVFKSEGQNVEKTFSSLNLKGSHQVENCGAALATLEVIKDQFPVNDAALAKGLKNINWPGRLQNLSKILSETKRIEIPDGWEIWLDGAHNKDGARILSTQAAAWAMEDGKKLHLILGMMQHKDPVPFINLLRPFADSISLVDIGDEPKSFKANDLAKIIGAPANAAYRDIYQAITAITAHEKKPGRILITGSLYLVGHVLKDLPQSS